MFGVGPILKNFILFPKMNFVFVFSKCGSKSFGEFFFNILTFLSFQDMIWQQQEKLSSLR